MFRKAVALLFLAAIPAAAQFPRARVVNTGPEYWVGLSYGFVDATTIFDGNTNTQWRLGYASQIRATFEKTLQSGITAGVSAAYATQPLTYTNTSAEFNEDCGTSCSAKADVTQYMAFIQGGGNTGFHIVYNLEAGFTQYSKFRVESTDTKLPPDKGGYDFSFGLGGGVGYGFSPTADLYVAEVVDFVLHPQGTSSSSSVPRLPEFRAGLKFGF